MANLKPFYIGTYTDANAPEEQRSQGIYQAKLDTNSGEIVDLRVAAWGVNAGFVVLTKERRFLYAIGSTFEQAHSQAGVVAAFAIAPDSGDLTFLNQQPTPNGSSCHINIDASNRLLVSVNYGRGSFATYPVAEDGRIEPYSENVQHSGKGVNPTRQEGPHAHQAVFSPDNRFLFVNDLGIDKIGCYAVEQEFGHLVVEYPTWTKVHDGAGPRHLDFHPNGKYVYLINELDATITAFGYDTEDGLLNEIQVISTLPAGFEGEKWCADIHVHPNGRFLYGSNRGHDSIAIYEIDEQSGKLRSIGFESTLGKTPRNFAIDPSGKFLLAANQDSSSIFSFAIDATSGLLTATGFGVTVPKPICIKFV